MHTFRYPLSTTNSVHTYEFTSHGPKGTIRKRIQFSETAEENIWNLGFGDAGPDDKIDDLAVTDNGDTEIVLATVVSAVRLFLDRYPDVFVFATGSTDARTRLYRMSITRYYAETIADFYLYGVTEESYEVYEPGKNYLGFLVAKRTR